MAEYIERGAAVQALVATPVRLATDKGKVIRAVEELQAADAVEVRHGYWDDNIIGFCNVCMECGAIVERTAIKSHTGALNYCPNCGAKMDGNGEGE